MLLWFVFSVLMAGATDTLKVNSEISNVTVYFTGAQIERVAKVKLTAGSQLVMIQNLPYQFDEKSLQVTLKPSIKLLSATRVQSEPIFNQSKLQLNYENQKDSLEREIRILTQKINTQRQIEKLILNNQQFKTKEGAVNLADVKSAAEFWDTKLNSCRELIFRYTYTITQIKEKIEKIHEKITLLQMNYPSYSSAVLVNLDCLTAQQSEITLSYLSAYAGWKPTYDFRVEEIGKPLSIIYRAEVYQSTGENWNAESITLSSGNPRQGGTKPELQPWYINQPQPIPYNPVYSSDNQGQLSGRVFDSRNQESLPAANVLLYLNNQLIQVYRTGEDGKYQFNPLQSGYYTIEVQYIGYAQTGRIGVSVNNKQITRLDMPLQFGYYASMNEIAFENEVMAVSDADMRIYDDVTYVPNQAGASANYTMKAPVASYSAIDMSIQEIEISRGGRHKKEIQEISFVENTVKPTAANLQYTIREKMLIASDGNNNKLKIKEVKIPVDYVYYVVPQLDPDAFLTAEVDGWEELNLLSGKTQIFYEGTFIAESYLDVLQTSDTLALSLGRDKNIAIDRIQKKNLAHKNIIGSNTRDHFLWNLTIRNNRNLAIQLVVEEQIPVSNQKDIEVNLINAGGGILDRNTGIITWKHKIEPSAKIEYDYEYQIKYPETVKINY